MTGHILAALLLAQPWLSYPRLARPALAVPGDTISVVFKASGPLSPLYITLISEFGSISLSHDEPEAHDTLYSLCAFIPYGAEPGLYALALSTPLGSDTQPNAVMIYGSWRDTVRFLHFTDIHIGYSARESQNYTRATREANLINPDFVIITGDIVEKGQVGDSPNWYREFLEISESLRVPCFVVSGNHDWYNWMYVGNEETNYLRIVNPYPDYAFDYGSILHMLCLDTGPDNIYVDLDSYCYGFRPDQLSFISQDLSQHRDYPLLMAMMHGPVIDKDDNDDSNTHGTTEFITYSETYGLDMAIAGHTHEDRLFLSDGTWVQGDLPDPLPDVPMFIQTTTTCKADPGSAGYRFISGHRGGLLEFTENGSADRSLRLYNLDDSYYYNNDSTTCAIVITNANNRCFYDGRVWPRMRSGYEYEVSGPGYIVKQAPSGLCEVAVDSIPPGTTVLYVGMVGQDEAERPIAPGLMQRDGYLWAYPGKGVSASLEIYDAAGRLSDVLFSGTWDSPCGFDLSALKPGVYVAILKGTKGLISARRVFSAK
ncbi:MAG: metallophosphoesterase [candidate division WOR-3 bacterium]